MTSNNPVYIDLGSGFRLSLPPNYKKAPLPGLKEWVGALTGGEYVQTRMKLRDGSHYCCLGVLSKIQGRLTNIHGIWHDGVNGECSVGLAQSNPLYHHLDSAGILPPLVRIQGIPKASESHGFRSARTDQSFETLATANDAGLTFEQIAKVISLVWEDASDIICSDCGHEWVGVLSNCPKCSSTRTVFLEAMLPILEAQLGSNWREIFKQNP